METSSKNPNASCQIQRNKIDDALVALVERHGSVGYQHVLGAAELPFDNQEIRASIKRLRCGGRLHLEHWCEKSKDRSVQRQTLTLHKPS